MVLSCGPFAAAFGRIAVATAVAALLLLFDRAVPPSRWHWPRLAVVTAGVVLAFPILTALALGRVAATHMALLAGALPLLMALWGQCRAGERPSGVFWLASTSGFSGIAWFAFGHAGGGHSGGLAAGDALLLAAAVAASVGYSEGGSLARELGGWRVICWALVLAAPIVIAGALAFPGPVVAAAGCALMHPSAAVGIAYLGLVSMLLAFFAWYHGLALGGIAKTSQVQLAQMPLSLAWSALLLGERIDSSEVITAAAVIGSLMVVVKTRVTRPAPLVGGPVS